MTVLLDYLWNWEIESSWRNKLFPAWTADSFENLSAFLDDELINHYVVPEPYLIFNVFNLTHFDRVKIVIIGQDPYPDPIFANGLSFSVNPGVRIPLSLHNIFKELSEDLSVPVRTNGSLTDWAEQGVLLLNTCLTTRAGSPGAHANHGWEEFTDHIIRLLSTEKKHLVFVLWGRHAISKESLIDETKHLVLRSSHPSFRSADKPCHPYPPFLHSKPFSKINNYLVEHNITPINWLEED